MSGVDVRVMVSARPSGNRLPHWAGNPYIADIVAGVRVSLRQRYLMPRRSASIRKVCSIGSANIDIRSFSINYELNAVLYSAGLAEELEEDRSATSWCCAEFDGRRSQAPGWPDSGLGREASLSCCELTGLRARWTRATDDRWHRLGVTDRVVSIQRVFALRAQQPGSPGRESATTQNIAAAIGYANSLGKKATTAPTVRGSARPRS